MNTLYIDNFNKFSGELLLDIPIRLRASQMALWWRTNLQCRRNKRHRFSLWVRKILMSRKWQLTSIFLPGKFHGQRSLAGYHLWGHKEVDRTGRRKTHTHNTSVAHGHCWMILHGICSNLQTKQPHVRKRLLAKPLLTKQRTCANLMVEKSSISLYF